MKYEVMNQPKAHGSMFKAEKGKAVIGGQSPGASDQETVVGDWWTKKTEKQQFFRAASGADK